MEIVICNKTYTIETSNNNLLSVLFNIKETQNRSLSFKSGCKSGVCGSCAVIVNGVETLACQTTINTKDTVTPLKNLPIIKDLIVDNQNIHLSLKTSHAYLAQNSHKEITIEDEQKIDLESNCILCNSCVSSCPVYTVNPNFLAPFALMRNYRYINDIKENEVETKLAAIQANGIWDCTLCGNCNIVCPSNIDIKGDIEKLRNKSAQFGYNNPNLNIGFGTNLDFGFNPNAF